MVSDSGLPVSKDDRAGGAKKYPWAAGLLPALAAGLAARGWYCLDLYRQTFFGYPLVDSLTYDRLAQSIIAGGSGEAFFRPPLYPYFLSVVYALAGRSQTAVVLLQFAMGLASIIPVYLLADRWFGRRAAALSAWVVAVYPLRIFFEGEILAVTLFGFLLAWGVWFFAKGVEDNSPRVLFRAGIFFGLGVLTRPNFLLALPFLATGALLAFRRQWKGRWPGLGWCLCGLTLAVAPATVHNWAAEGKLIPVAANGGVNFYLGNRPGSTGETPLPPGLIWQDIAQEPLRQGKMTRSDQDRYWWGKAIRSIEGEVGGWLTLLGRKGLLYWNAHESSNNKSLPFFTRVSFPVKHYRWWYGLLVCLAVARLLIVPPGPGEFLLASLLIGYSIAVSLFFVSARYRLPMVPFMAILAAASLTGGVSACRRGEWRRVAGMFVAGLAAGAVVFPGWFRAGGGRIDHDFQMGQVYLSRGEPGRAENHLLRSRERTPDDPDVYHSLGAASFLRGDWKGAAEYYLKALEQGEFSEVYFNLGVVYERMGAEGREKAIRAYRRALEINPLEARAGANLEYLIRNSQP